MDESWEPVGLDKDSTALLNALQLTLNDMKRKSKMGGCFSQNYKLGNEKFKKACYKIFRINQHLSEGCVEVMNTEPIIVEPNSPQKINNGDKVVSMEEDTTILEESVSSETIENSCDLEKEDMTTDVETMYPRKIVAINSHKNEAAITKDKQKLIKNVKAEIPNKNIGNPHPYIRVNGNHDRKYIIKKFLEEIWVCEKPEKVGGTLLEYIRKVTDLSDSQIHDWFKYRRRKCKNEALNLKRELEDMNKTN